MKLFYTLLTLILIFALSGCGSEQEDLQAWMTEQRNAARPRMTPLPAPSQFTPQTYDYAELVEPFNSQKLTQVLQATQPVVNIELIAPELVRRKEPLEASPLDTIVMVGSLIKGGQLVALVRVDNLVHYVRVGNYLGQNYGRITELTESSLVLREIVQDSAGEWTERMATLQLSEETKK
jgi:type IV pilus assembly protein PilP